MRRIRGSGYLGLLRLGGDGSWDYNKSGNIARGSISTDIRRGRHACACRSVSGAAIPADMRARWRCDLGLLSARASRTGHGKLSLWFRRCAPAVSDISTAQDPAGPSIRPRHPEVQAPLRLPDRRVAERAATPSSPHLHRQWRRRSPPRGREGSRVSSVCAEHDDRTAHAASSPRPLRVVSGPASARMPRLGLSSVDKCS